jgi:hypothetical protein
MGPWWDQILNLMQLLLLAAFAMWLLSTNHLGYSLTYGQLMMMPLYATSPVINVCNAFT